MAALEVIFRLIERYVDINANYILLSLVDSQYTKAL